MLRTIYILLIFFFAINFIHAKDFPKMEDAPVKLSKFDQKKLDKANELFREGMELWNTLNSNYNPDNATTYKIDSTYNKDAYPVLMKASDLFFESNKIKLEIYTDNCKDFWTKHKYDSPSGLENAKKFEKEAALYYDKALLNRRVADELVNRYVESYNRLFEAISLEIISVKKEGRALQIYRDWPAHFGYEFDEDIEVNLFAEKPKIVDNVKAEDTMQVAIATPKEPEPQPHDSTIIYYSVQIAAHTIPMTMNYIRNEIYHGPMLIQEIREDGWYKYLIGHYKKPEEALKLLREIKVDKAFVVAYRNGKRVPLKEITDSPE